MKISNYKIISISLAAGFIFTLNTAFAQRYRNRDQQPQQYNDRQMTQDSLDNQSFADRLVKGANFDLSIYPNTYIDVSPLIGYRITPKLQAGIGISYIYTNDLYPVYDANGNIISTYRQEESAYGARVYAEYDVVPLGRSLLFAHFEFEDMNVPYTDPTTYKIARYWLQSPYIGIGLREPIGQKAFINFSVLLNTSYNQFAQYNPFTQVVERIGVTF